MTGMEWIALGIGVSIMAAIGVFVWRLTSH